MVSVPVLSQTAASTAPICSSAPPVRTTIWWRAARLMPPTIATGVARSPGDPPGGARPGGNPAGVGGGEPLDRRLLRLRRPHQLDDLRVETLPRGRRHAQPERALDVDGAAPHDPPL